jgi:hypothetical protein
MSKLIDVSTAFPIDLTKAIELSNGQKSIFFKMLEKLEHLSLIPNLRDIAAAVEAQDFLAFKNKVHMLKGASGYVAAGPVHYCCFFIQDNYNKENFEGMMAYYPTLIEAAIDLRIYSKKLIAEFKGETYNWLTSVDNQYDESKLPEEVFTVPIAPNFIIDRVDGKFYCLRPGQSGRLPEIVP